MWTLRLMTIGTCCAAMTFFAAGARAQPPGRGQPNRVAATAARDRMLALSLSAGGGCDANALAEDNGIFSSASARQPRASVFTDFSGDLRYLLKGARFDLTASASSDVRRYPAIMPQFIASHSTALAAIFAVNRRTRLALHQTASWQPFYAFVPFDGSSGAAGGETFVPGVDTAILKRSGITSATSVEGSRTVSRDATFSGTYQYRSSNFSGTSLDLHWNSGSARLKREFGRGLALDGRYSYEQGYFESSGGRSVHIHHVDSGFDRTRAVSATRSASFSGGLGAAFVTDGPRRSVIVTAHAGLRRDLAKTWQGDLDYRRDAGFVHNLPAPAVSQAINAGLAGSLNRRLTLRTSASYTNGSISLTGPRSSFDLYRVTAAVDVPLNRSTMAVVEAFDYYYSFPAADQLLAAWPTRVHRPGIRAHVVMLLPLVERTRRRDAAR